MAVVFRNIVSNQIEEGSRRSIDNQPFEERSKKYRRRRRKRRKSPKHRKLFAYPDATKNNGEISFSKKLGPYYNWENDFIDINEISDSLEDYTIDFYEDKDYEYIDQEDSESMNFDELDKEDIYNMKFDFKNIDYDSYEYEEVGILNFREPEKVPETPDLSTTQFSKRKIPLPIFYSQEQVPRRKRFKKRIKPGSRLRPNSKRPGLLVRRKPGLNSQDRAFLDGLQSRFDLSSLVGIAGLWVVWQVYLVSSINYWYRNIWISWNLLHFRAGWCQQLY